MFDVLAMMTVRSISGRPVRGSVEQREFLEHARHLVAALAAAEIDDDVGVAALRERFEEHRLAGAEAAGHRGLAALRDREERIDDALAGDERRERRQPPRDRARHAHRPVVPHRELARRAVVRRSVQIVASSRHAPAATTDDHLARGIRRRRHRLRALARRRRRRR